MIVHVYAKLKNLYSLVGRVGAKMLLFSVFGRPSDACWCACIKTPGMA